MRHQTSIRFPKLLELGLCSTGLCEEDLARVLAGSPKLEKLAFICGHVALTRIDPVSSRLRCVLFWHAVPSRELAMVDRSCLERIILWKEDAYSLALSKIGSAGLQIGDKLIMVRTYSQISTGLFNSVHAAICLLAPCLFTVQFF